MATVSIPNWNAQGVIPPLHSDDPTSTKRSPYRVSLTDLVLRFGTTARRKTILNGLLRFRSALHNAGFTNGFQWVDGSFLEHIEQIERRDPGDIDVVTFYHLPEGQTQQSLFQANRALMDPRQNKASFHVDGYFVHLLPAVPETLVENTTYWYSVWSHRRDSLWKGYLQIDLAPTEDTAVMVRLDIMRQENNES